MENNENKTNVLLLTVIGVATLLVAVIGATFAYFTANLSGQETSTTMTVKAGTLQIAYDSGDGALSTPTGGIVPQQKCTKTEASGTETIPYRDPCITDSEDYPYGKPVITKEFTVTGTNTTAALVPYSIDLIVQTNTFSTDALTYTLESTNTGANGTIATAVTVAEGIDTSASTVALGSGYFSGVVSNSVHTYVLKIYFTDTDVAQDDDKGASFTGYVKITTEAAYTTTAP